MDDNVTLIVSFPCLNLNYKFYIVLKGMNGIDSFFTVPYIICCYYSIFETNISSKSATAREIISALAEAEK